MIASVVPLVPAWRVARTFDYAVPEPLSGRVAVGSLVRVPFGHRRVRGIVVALGEGDGEGLEEIAGLVIGVPVAPPPLPDVLDWIACRYPTPRGRVYERVVPPRVRVKVGVPGGGRTPPAGTHVLAGYEGGEALEKALGDRRAGIWCVQSLGGEERARLLVDLLSVSAGACLACVPEVRYGNRVLEAVLRAFPEAVRVDSAAGDAERARGLLSLASGARIGIGGRATVLAPVPELALIVVEEEHHVSFKEDRAPRYDARRVSMERSARSGAACVLMSTTPSVEWGWAARSGTMGWVGPTRAAARAAAPLVQLVPPPRAGLSHDLHRAVREQLHAGGRVGLLVPSPGYARALWCSLCRRSIRCPRCEAGMASARRGRSIACPRCGLERDEPSACPNCGGREFRYLGAGSERLEEQLRHAFPRARVGRMDPEMLEALGEGAAGSVEDADIYVTTWIGTKPVIRPQVSLVGVLDADALIRRPDFRAAERAFQALSAMAEWAGPRERGGRLVIQTAEPNHHSVQAVVRADYGFFLEREAEQRRELGYPPFSELVKVRAVGADAEGLLEEARGLLGNEVRVLGPVPVEERRGVRGLELLVKCPDAQEVTSALRVILPRVPAGTRLRVDADPR